MLWLLVIVIGWKNQSYTVQEEEGFVMICAALLEGTKLGESIPIINSRLENNTAQPFTGIIYLMD